MQKEANKVWETFGTFELFEEADLKRIELLKVYELVKVKRFGEGGNAFKVKFWSPPIIKETKKKKRKEVKMPTSRFVIDSNGKRAHLGSKVFYKNKIWLLEDIEYLSWSADQYITLRDLKNKNKKAEFVRPEAISVIR